MTLTLTATPTLTLTPALTPSALCLQVREGNERALELYRRNRYEVLDSRVPVDVPAWQERWKGGAPGTPLTLMRKRVDLPLDQLLERLPRRQWSGKRGVRAIRSIDPYVRSVSEKGERVAWGAVRVPGRQSAPKSQLSRARAL